MTVDDLVHIIQSGGGIGVAAFIIIGFLMGWIVPGHVYDDCKVSRDQWQKQALDGGALFERSLDVIEQTRDRRAPSAARRPG